MMLSLSAGENWIRGYNLDTSVVQYLQSSLLCEKHFSCPVMALLRGTRVKGHGDEVRIGYG